MWSSKESLSPPPQGLWEYGTFLGLLILLPVRGVGGRGPPVSLYTSGASEYALLRDNRLSHLPLTGFQEPSAWGGTQRIGYVQRPEHRTVPGEPHQLSGAPPPKGPRALRGPDRTQVGRQGKGGGQGTSGNGWRGSLGLREACVGTLAASHSLEGSSLTGPTSLLCPSHPPPSRSSLPVPLSSSPSLFLTPPSLA